MAVRGRAVEGEVSEGFRNRGLRTVVDTTETAELDALHLALPEDVLRRIARSLNAAAASPEDVPVGSLRVRRIAEHDVLFQVYPTAECLAVVVLRIVRPVADEPFEAMLKRLTLAATFRGAFGV